MGSFETRSRVGNLAYRLILPPNLAAVHDVFHVSMLRKYIPDPSHVIEYEPLQIRADVTYDEKPLRVIDVNEQVLRTWTIRWVKILQENHSPEEATWELEEQVLRKYPHLFTEVRFTFGGPNVLRRGGCNTLTRLNFG